MWLGEFGPCPVQKEWRARKRVPLHERLPHVMTRGIAIFMCTAADTKRLKWSDCESCAASPKCPEESLFVTVDELAPHDLLVVCVEVQQQSQRWPAQPLV